MVTHLGSHSKNSLTCVPPVSNSVIILNSKIFVLGFQIMGYVEDTLGSGETIEYDVSFHWLWTFSAYTIFVIMGAAALALYLLLNQMISIEAIEPMVRFIPSLLLASIGLVIFLFMMIKKVDDRTCSDRYSFYPKDGVDCSPY